MSETYRFTVRLSSDEKAQLERLSAQLELDKSATIRHALQTATRKTVQPKNGCFTAAHTRLSFPIRLKRSRL